MTSLALARKNDDPRAMLRAAIAGAAEARQTVSTHEAAIEKARALLKESELKLAAAITGVTEDARASAQAISSGGAPSARATRAARAAETDARDEVEAARAARKQLEDDLADSEDELQRADKAVDAAITAALELVARELLDQARSHRTEFLKRMYAVDAIRLMVPNDINEAAQRLWFLSLRKLWSFPARSSRAGKPRWRRSSPTRTRRYPIKGNGSVFGQSALLPKTTKQ